MKRYLALILVFVMVLGVLSGCQQKPNETAKHNPTPWEEQQATQSPEEQEVLKVLTIGNSGSTDAEWLLYHVFQTEMPEQKVVVGILYYSGCLMEQHADHIKNNKPVYTYYKNETGTWETTNGVTVKTALEDEQWDIVVMQQHNRDSGVASLYVADQYMTVINHIYENQELKPKLAFHMVWSFPDQPEYMGGDEKLSMNEAWVNSLKAHFSNSQGNYDHTLMHPKVRENVKKYLEDTTEFLGRNYYDFIIPSGTAMDYAQDVLNRPQSELYRDYAHLTDYGRVIAAYVWYAKLMGLESLPDINLSMIPSKLTHYNSYYPINQRINSEMKADLLEAVNWALKNPYTLPAA